jgi:hypothetical protein
MKLYTVSWNLCVCELIISYLFFGMFISVCLEEGNAGMEGGGGGGGVPILNNQK